MEYFDRVVKLVNSYEHLGKRSLPNGTRLIGHVPHVAPQAWLHVLFPPLTGDQLSQVEREIDRQLPRAYADFLAKSNGLWLFSGALTLDGLRWSYVRSGDAVWQPFSIATPNVNERPRGAKGSAVFVGGYQFDGSLLYIDADALRTYRCARTSANPLNEWPSFEAMLEAEATRLATLFDQSGRRIGPNVPTTP